MQLRQKTLTAVLITGACLLSGGLAISQDAAKQAERSIAGIPLEEAIEIHERYAGILRKLPGVVSVALSKDGLVVETVNPSALPPTVEELPVIPIPPIDPWAGRTIDGSTPVPLREPAEIPPFPTPPVANEPKEYECPPGAFRRPGEERCRFLNPPPDPPIVELLPPPPGVIVLRPGKVREQADTCPQDFKEVEGDNNWRFCIDPKNPEKIPPLWSPPIANIPFETALEIHQRHIEDFVNLPGTHSVGLGADGIYVYTSNPDVVPKEVEGLPIKVFLWEGRGVKPLSHTLSSSLRPLHGAAFIDDSTLDGGGTVTGIALSQGKPWLIFPSHLLNNCNQPSPCALNTAPLNQCPHYMSGNQLRILQPPSTSFPVVGYAQRWTQLIGTGTTADVAAAFMDSDLTDGNGSLSADRRVENATSNSVPFLGTTISEFPSPGSQVRMRPSIGPPHELTLRVEQVNLTVLGVGFCAGASVNVSNQIQYTMLGGYTFEGGDSGSPVSDSTERLVGMINLCVLGNSTPPVCTPTGYGTDAFAIKNVLRFDAWYGTQTVPDQTIGVFRPGPHQWFMDNGSNRLDACGADQRYNDICLGAFGSTGERPVVGNWTGRGVYTAGQYRIGIFSPAINAWILDSTGNGTYDDCNLPTGDWCPQLSISQSTDLPIVGDWNGDGRIKIGQFRPSTAQWFLDWNGNGVWNGCSTDRCYTFGSANDKPVVGDWSGNGRTKIGVFRNGTWFLDASGNGIYGTGDRSFTFGVTGDTPVAGNWSGTPKSKIGVFRYELGQGVWFLDGDGSETFSGCSIDGCYVYGSQASGDLPVTWGPSTVRAN